MSRILKWLAAVVVVGLIAMFSFGMTRDPSLIPSPLIDHRAPEFRLARLDGSDSVDLRALRGRPVLINYWASWCLACREEHPVLIRAWERYRSRGLQMIGIVYQDKPENARAYLAENGGGWVQLVDPGDLTAINYGVYGVPETFFVDATGRIVFKQIGPVTDSLVAREVEPLLAADSAVRDGP